MTERYAGPRVIPHYCNALLRVLCTGLMLAALTSCSDILGLREGYAAAPPCLSDEECASGSTCESSSCLPATCSVGEQRCSGLDFLRCGRDSKWVREPCDAICTDQGCDTPPSCSFEDPKCGIEPERVSCCSSIALESRTFEFSYANSDPDDESSSSSDGVRRTVRSFALDRFEVSVSRFRQYLLAFDREGHPPADAGAHPAFSDSGWRVKWSNEEQLPGSQIALEGVLHRKRQEFSLNADGELPIGGVDWYLAFAFCIWEGARLPTEAEWAFAASGGSSDQEYPWQAMDVTDPPITHDQAQYSDDSESNDAPAHVGSHPAGRGVFGHQDLAGNVAEWVADVHHRRLRDACPASGSESALPNECLERTGGDHRVIRGGSYNENEHQLRNVQRRAEMTDYEQPWYGFRCARDVGSR